MKPSELRDLTVWYCSCALLEGNNRVIPISMAANIHQGSVKHFLDDVVLPLIEELIAEMPHLVGDGDYDGKAYAQLYPLPGGRKIRVAVSPSPERLPKGTQYELHRTAIQKPAA